MLIGPTLTLKELEEHMEAKLMDNRNATTKLTKLLTSLQSEIGSTSKFVTNEEGERVVNKRFIEITEEFASSQRELVEIQDSNDFMSDKIAEIEDLVEAAGRNGNHFNKEAKKITLTLNDCLRLGVEPKAGE